MARHSSSTCNEGKKTIKSPLNERNEKAVKARRSHFNREARRSLFGRENIPPSPQDLGLTAVGQQTDGELTEREEDMTSIPDDLLMAAITKEILSKMKNPSAQSIKSTKECELCGLYGIHGNSRAKVCRLCKLCTPNPDALIPLMKSKRQEQIPKELIMKAPSRSRTPVAMEQPPQSNSNSTDRPPSATCTDDDMIQCPPSSHAVPPANRSKKTVTNQTPRPLQVRRQGNLFKYLQKI